MSAERPCEVCGAGSPEPLYEVRGFPIVRCPSCGLVFVGRTPTAEELVALYDESYWEDPEEAGYGGYAAAEQRKRRHFQTLLADVEALHPPGDLLEVGSAYGYFLDEARRRGWRVRGVEPSPHAAAHARRRLDLGVSAGPLSALEAEPGSQDVIVLWDVIEHLPDPRRTLECAHAWLRPGGIVALSTGDVRSLSARLHGPDWSLMTPPWHQFYFSRRAVRRLLADVGFQVERIGGDGVVGIDPGSPRPRIAGPLARMLGNRAVTTLARRLGAGMTMFAFARKAEQ